MAAHAALSGNLSSRRAILLFELRPEENASKRRRSPSKRMAAASAEPKAVFGFSWKAFQAASSARNERRKRCSDRSGIS
ncbi:MAG: hypothetical protein ACLPSF_07870 [Methylocella sp.]